MKKIILALMLLGSITNVLAWGQAYLQSCSYGYNSDYGKGSYTGVYKHSSGRTYRYFFPSNQYSWCPQTIDF